MRVSVKVKSGSKDPEVYHDCIIIYTTAKRENDRANVDIVRQLSRLYDKDQAKVRLIAGRRSRNKVFQIEE